MPGAEAVTNRIGSGTLKFRGTYSLQLYALLSEGSFCIVGLCLLLAALIQGDDIALVIVGALITAATLPFVALMGSVALRPMVLTDDFLKVPGPIRSRRISLGEIAGVGLLYRSGTRVPSGWFLEAWDFTGRAFEIDRMAIITGHRDRPHNARHRNSPPNGVGLDPEIPIPHEDSGELAHSRAGEAAKEIYVRALAKQGPKGPLAVEALQKTVKFNHWSDRATIAWWSPDGTMGRVDDVRE